MSDFISFNEFVDRTASARVEHHRETIAKALRHPTGAGAKAWHGETQTSVPDLAVMGLTCEQRPVRVIRATSAEIAAFTGLGPMKGKEA